MARVPYLKREELSAAGQSAYDRISAARGGHVSTAFRALLHSPELAGRIGDVGTLVRSVSTIPPDTRETTILAVAREIRCQYEFTHHVPLAQAAGVRDLVIDGIKARSTKGMIPKESVYVDYSKQVLGGRVNDPTFTAIEHLLGRQGAVDLTLLIGYYGMMGSAMMALGVDLEEGTEPLMPVP